MRARWLKPEFFTDKKIAQMDPMTALVYQALWCWADDGGTVQADPDLLKAHVFFRWSAVTVRTITGALQELSALGRIELYRVGDDLYANICNWSKHQAVHKPSKFRYPQLSQGVPVKSASLVPEDALTSAEIPNARILESQNPRIPESHSSSALSRVEKLEAAVVGFESTSSPQRDEPEPSAEKASPRRKSRLTPNVADTFRLAPYLEAHTERFPGSTVQSPGRYGKVFKRLEKEHGAEETLRRWKIMLAVEGKYATPEKLSTFWSIYDGAEAPDPWRHLAGYPDIVDKDGCFTEYGERVTRPESPVRLVG